MKIQYSIHEIQKNPLLLNKFTKNELHSYFEDLIINHSLESIDDFIHLPFPKNKETGVFIKYNKTKSISFYEEYLHLALKNQRTDVFKYFYKQSKFKTFNCFTRCCNDNNLSMIEFLLDNFKPSFENYNNSDLFWCINNDFIEQFKYLSTTGIFDLTYNNHELIKKSCVEDKKKFIEILIIDCNLLLDKNITAWLHGDNENETIYTLPFELVEKKKLYHKLNNLLENDNDKNKKKPKI